MKIERSSVALLPACGCHLRRELLRALEVLMVASLIATSCPPKARAIAVVDDAIIAGVSVILTSIGVTYWANNETNAKAQLRRWIGSYLSAAYPEQEISYQEWLDVYSQEAMFASFGRGVISFGSNVANKVLEFARWLKNRESITSGGQDIVYRGNPAGLDITVVPSPTPSLIHSGGITRLSDSSFSYQLSAENVSPDVNFFAYYILTFPTNGMSSIRFNLLAEGDGYYISFNGGDNYANNRPNPAPLYNRELSYVSGDSFALYIRLFVGHGSSVSNHLIVELLDDTQYPMVPIGRLSPSNAVSVPEDIAPNQTLTCTTNAGVTAEDDADTATQAVYDAITGVNGLTSEASEQPIEGELGFLQAIYQKIIAIPQAIAEALTPQYTEIDDYTLSLTSVFPFCIPWDIARCLSYFAADPVIPRVTWNMPLPDLIGGGTYALTIDLAPFDTAAEVLRHLELIAFAVGLMIETKRIVKW